MKGEISRNETNAAALAVSHVIPLLVSMIVYAVIAVSAVVMCSCGGKSNSNLKKAVAELNNMCPIDYGNGVKLVNTQYDESRNEVTMTLTSSDGNLDIATLNSNAAIMKKQMCMAFSQDKENAWLVELANAGASFKVVFKTMPSGKSAVLTFTPEEVKKIVKGNVNVSQSDMAQGLDTWVAMQNQVCPQDLGDGISITQVVRDGNNVVMYVQVDNENMDYLRSNAGDIDAAKGEILAELAGDGVVRLMVSNGAGYVYRFFVDDPTDCVDIEFTVDELRSSIN